MEGRSPFLAMQEAERQIKSVLRGIDAELLEPAEKKAVTSLRRLSVDARLDKLQKAILAAGPAVFGPADVAQLSAHLEQIGQHII